MNITKIEIIKSLLDDPKVESVEVKYREGFNEAVFTLKVFSSKSLIFKSLRHPMTAIQSFTPIYHPTPDIDVGDIVWCKRESVIGWVECIDIYTLIRFKNEDGVFAAHVCDQSDLTLLKKAESND